MPCDEIDESGGDQRTQGENHGGGVAAGVGDEMRAGDLGAMQFRHSVDGLRLNRGCNRRAVVLEGIDGAIGCFVQAPCAAEIDDAQAVRQSLRHPFARLLVRRGEKQNLDAAVGEQLPGKRLELQRSGAIVVGELGMNFDERNAAARRILGVDTSRKDRRRAFEARMVQQQPGQFGARVARHTDNRSLNFRLS